jgi:hypothetical protein
MLALAAKLFVKSGDQFIRVTTNVSTALYFGSTKMNNNFSVVDAVAEQGGRGMAATLFVKSGDQFIRVTTNVSTRVGSGRGIGTILTGPGPRVDQSGQCILRQGAGPWHALYQWL